MFGVYVTHPQVQIDPTGPVTRWMLSAKGRARAEAAATRDWVARLGRIVASDETKAIDTARILARAIGLAVEVRPDLHENDRSSTGYLEPPDFEAAADRFFADPDTSFRGWETATSAQSRIVGAVDAVLTGHSNGVPVEFVGHGAVGTLLRLALLRSPISRDGDQPPGGGHLFAFDLVTRKPACTWVPFEDWDGPSH